MKNIGITYYGLSEDEVKDYKKPELCKVIRKTLNRIRKAKDIETYLETNTSKVDTKNKTNNNNTNKTNNTIDTIDTMDNNSDLYNMKYPGDIQLCNEPPKKGGINYSKLKHIAENNFNIDITNITRKDELCELIKNKLDLELIKKGKKMENTKTESTFYNNKEDKYYDKEEDEDEEEDEEDEEDEEEELTDDD